MIRFYPNEQFREITNDDPRRGRYAISNKGRFVNFTDEIKNGKLLKGGLNDRYRIHTYRYKEGTKTVTKNLYFYKLVAEYFIPKTSEDQICVIHLDHSRDNDDVNNLRWATREEMLAHQRKSPHVKLAYAKLHEHNKKADGKKLTSTKVIRLKKLLNNPERKTRLKMIAKQFGVSSTHIKRIERGENWGHIKV